VHQQHWFAANPRTNSMISRWRIEVDDHGPSSS
jgi:hypothetical protein